MERNRMDSEADTGGAVSENTRQILGWKDLFKTSLPLIFDGGTSSAESFIRSLILSHANSNFLAVESLNGMMLTFLLSSDGGLVGAIGTLTSCYYGRRDFEKIGKITQNSWVIAAFFTIPTIMVLLLSRQILEAFHQPPELIDKVVNYSYIMCFACPAIYLNQVNFSYLKNIKKVNILIPFYLCTSAIGILITYLLIHGKLGFPQCGVNSSAYATLVQSWACAISMIFFLRRNEFTRYKLFKKFTFDRLILKKILKIGVPLSLTLLFEQASVLVIGLFIGQQGTNVLNINRACELYFQLLWPIGFAIRQGAQINMSILFGQKKYADSQKFGGWGLLYELSCYIFMTFLYLVIPLKLSSVFISKDVIYKNEVLIKNIFITKAIAMTLKTFQDAAFGCLRSILDTFNPFVIKTLCYSFLTLGLSLIFKNIFNQQVIGLNVAVISGTLISATWLFLRWKKLMHTLICSENPNHNFVRTVSDSIFCGYSLFPPGEDEKHNNDINDRLINDAVTRNMFHASIP